MGLPYVGHSAIDSAMSFIMGEELPDNVRCLRVWDHVFILNHQSHRQGAADYLAPGHLAVKHKLDAGAVTVAFILGH